MKLVVALYVVAVAWLNDAAVAFVVLGTILGATAFVLWVKNRHDLRSLDAYLALKARTGMAVLVQHQRASGDGV